LGPDNRFWYLASPYSRFRDGREAAYKAACHAAAVLARAGVPVFSPIAHSHGIAENGGINPVDHSIWLPADRPFMDAAKGIIVLKLAGWQTSVGVNHEIGYFARDGKPVIYMEPGVVPQELYS
jgi:nucleoside 2-deoxyribosyltransferase